MKMILLVVFLVVMGFVWVNRQRVYVRDPLAVVYRSQGSEGGPGEVKQSGVQVFINYSDDVLVEQDAQPGGYRILVQGWNKMPGTPGVLKIVS